MESHYPPNIKGFTTAREAHVLAELYDALDSQPGDIEMHELLIKTLMSIGQLEMANDAAEVLVVIDPNNAKAQECLRHEKPSGSLAKEKSRTEDPEAEKKLEDGYRSLQLEANILKVELESPYFRNIAENQDRILLDLHEISKGNMLSTFTQPVSVSEAAQTVLANPEKATNIVAEDFGAVLRWMTCQVDEHDNEKLRQRLMKRRSLLEAALPASIQRNIAAAFRQIEREHLNNKYANAETMLGDKIEDIPKPNFFVSDDNYAFDMEELAQAIEAQDGVMRNPLSKLMFSQANIQTILEHPLGKRLKPLEEAQHLLKRGVRPATIAMIDKLSDKMLKDQSMDAGPSRKAIDEFLAFVATLPHSEQSTIRKLKIPAKDRNTGQPFDYSIGESVDDAKTGSTCYHKVGDFLSQAAQYLQRQ